MYIFEPNFNEETHLWEVNVTDSLESFDVDVYSFKTKKEAEAFVKNPEEKDDGV